MHLPIPRRAAALFLLTATLSCEPNQPIAPIQGPLADIVPGVRPELGISQVYGGGGNAGATLRNDFIELYNPGSGVVDLSGWSVQYASASGTTWQVTALGGSVPPGGYYLVQEAVGAGGTVNLPTPDATGTIAMSGTAGKVWLVHATTALTGACPTGAAVVDEVSYGAAASNCGFQATGTLGNTTAATRNESGCAYTGNLSADFVVAAPSPRNGASAAHSCGATSGPLDHVTIEGPSAVIVGTFIQLTATPQDASNQAVTTATIAWASSDESVATVDASGKVTGVASSAVPVTITATAVDGSITTSASFDVTVTSPATGRPEVLVSQIYGGGGNSGATYRNDFIELYNPGTGAVSLAGWSVQYTSAAGTSWQVTPLSGTIQPGRYHLVQEAAGSGGTVDLPAPDVTGAIPMGAGAGKVWLVRSTTALTGTCPGGSVDQVSYGTTATDCGIHATPTLTNTTVALRKDAGCAYTPDLSGDFETAAPAPRNSASPVHVCPGVLPVGPLDHVVIAGPGAVIVGNTIQLIASAQDVNNQTVGTAAISWSSADPSVATVDANGMVTGVAASASPVVITATAVDNGITRTASAPVTVNMLSINWIDISSSSASFPPGFQTQLFATARVASGGTVLPATFTFESLDPSIATVAVVANTGIITGVSASGTRPRIRIVATPVGGGTPYEFTATPVTIESPNAAPTSIYADNDEFGDPTPATPSDPNDLLIVRPQYTLSYNASRGTPNWVSYELDARQMVAGQDRCNCFSADPLLPADRQIFTSDYTNGGFDRGHMTRSADRTAGNVDNAITFYLTNIVPQFADLNQGVWAQFENALADSARAGRAVYVITGPLYSRSHGLTFIKNEGKVAVPDSTWKVAFIGPDPGGVPFTLANVQSQGDLAAVTVLAVNMPNTPGVRNNPWAMYLTTVDRIEEATGYDLLDLLADPLEQIVESNDHPPVASAGGPYAGTEGTPISFSAAGSTDPDGDALTYAWDFGDGSTGVGAQTDHVYADNGSFSVTVTVTDSYGATSTAGTAASVINANPAIASVNLPGAAVRVGQAALVQVTATDPGAADTHLTIIDWGDGSTSTTPGEGVSPEHVYTRAGFYHVAVTVQDDDGGIATAAPVGSIVVYDPAAGFLTGAGIFGTLRDRSSFAFAAAYLPGKAVPQAIVEFHSRGELLLFSAQRTAWMVVRDGKATLRGEGVIGKKVYQYLLVAIDGPGRPDGFRIKIWDSNGVLYDNQPGASDESDAVSGLLLGSIDIHRGTARVMPAAPLVDR